jgi:hypothetical protein
MGDAGTQMLKTRKLENKTLEEKEQKKYDNLIASMEKRATAAPTGAANPAQGLIAEFQLAATHLHYNQEAAAAEAFGKAWDSLAGMMKEAKTAAAGLGQVRTHLKTLQTLAAKDPELVLTLMSELSEKQTAAYNAIENPKVKPQLANPIATTWAAVMQKGQLDKETQSKAAKWILMFPQMAMADRPLSEQQQGEVQSQVAQANTSVNAKLRQLAERLVATSRGDRPVRQAPPPGQTNALGVPLGENGATREDPALLEAYSLLEPKSAAITRFMEADIYLRWGQFHEGAAATANGWKELLEIYRGNNRLISPLDTEVHFETFDQLATRNPMQAVILLAQLDQAYRAMAKFDAAFATRIADLWIKVEPGVSLNAAMLETATFWVTSASKLGKKEEAKYSKTAEDFKLKLADARKAEGLTEDSDEAKENKADKKSKDEDKSEKSAQENEEKSERRVGGRKLPLPPNPNKREEQ